jgi:hypothetical protein
MSVEPLAVTWSAEPTQAWIDEVRQVAARWRLPVYERPKKGGLHRQLGRFADAFLVLGGAGWTLVDAAGVLQVSPGLAMLRRKRLLDPQAFPDQLLRHAQITPGERIVDGTLGLGADARVLATATGARGRVIGLEASLPLAALLSQGIVHEPPWPDTAPIDIVHTNAGDWLAAQPPASVDLIYFDPMFERAKSAPAAFSMLRRYAEARPLTVELVAQARRVARRMVLVKSEDPRLFPTLGLEPLAPISGSTLYWGRYLKPLAHAQRSTL